ncbi:enoyl-CoA hydratase/isomerase family protein [Falsigemmobacter intermedius]|uniref:Enoyl-CoA hydratase/isomerase family protein n=1 Tax=Falsigemmobacter intermedius TaxID=1553448 RepID=A0A3S3VCM2_9RHOB|nr:enoyl-CoA hydratase/isomerase family protein [Falsigemmobacter intermedius]RWY45559.1 enoyl-CoA hydratase/isomerase family protein [Falsigemmobacter intermedius]
MIRVEDEGALRVLTIARPDKANSLTGEMLIALRDAVRGAAEAGVQVLILTGEGRVFSAGADLEEAKAGLALSPLWEELSGAIAAFPGLSIAALNGTLAGGANGMALACDLRLGVPGMSVFYPVMKLGYLPQPSDPGRLRALVGPSRAKMILVCGEKIPAEEALAWGLLDRLVAPETLLEAAKALAAPVLTGKPGHAAAIAAMIPG